MHRSMFRAAREAALLCMAALASSCSADLHTVDDASDTVFLTQATPPGAVMEALYEGRVYRDEQGCLRLETMSGMGHTAVWPYGFTLETRGGASHVVDPRRRSIGRVGGSFRFGGGEVPSAEWADLTTEQRALAQSRCPGRYWVVGETDLRS